MIAVRDLRKTYQMGRSQVHALAGITLDVPEGAFIAVMGPSGSGKSTLLNLIGGLDRPTSGCLHVAGREIGELDENALAAYRQRLCGFIFQTFNLVGTMTALQNVEFPMVFARTPRAERHRRARYLLTAVGLGDRLDHRPTELSGGEQQRVAVARALVNTPRVLLADEPTGNLDSHTGAEIMDLLTRVQREGNLTVLVVTHDATVAAYAHQVIRMRDGMVQPAYT
ncbi:MAG: macrolide ABC transporter ATP-binding protein [Chloroflexi bacterium HGW-Chloroflexi-1]|nr:MAG: macrolide ABC transporter ATP-binding protein [Chloroflexi bacterium HGW-Chloroflexi-1]